MKYIKLAERFSIKGDYEHIVLFDMKTGKRFSLSLPHKKFVELCDGCMSEEELFDNGSKASGLDGDSINNFLKTLKKIDAINTQDKKSKRRISYIAEGSQLRIVQWELTGLCNLKCLHCYQYKYLENNSDLDLLNCKKIICELAELGVEKISISGGEPLMRPDLMEILRFIETKNIQVESIFTNGTLISEELLMLLSSLESGVSFHVSLDGISSKALLLRGFNKISARGFIKKIKNNLVLLKKYKLPIRINTILNKNNLFEMDKIYNFISGIGGITWSIGFPREMGACVFNRNKILINIDTMFKICKKLIIRHVKAMRDGINRINLKIQYLFHEKFIDNLNYYSLESPLCGYEGKEESCCIKPNGDVLPCSVFFSHIVGNIKKEKMEAIWNSPKMRAIRGLKIKDIKKCCSCRYYHLCGGGCRATANFYYKNIKKEDKLACRAMKYFFKEIFPILK